MYGTPRVPTGCEMRFWAPLVRWVMPTWISLKKYRKTGLELRLSATHEFRSLSRVCSDVRSEGASDRVLWPCSGM